MKWNIPEFGKCLIASFAGLVLTGLVVLGLRLLYFVAEDRWGEQVIWWTLGGISAWLFVAFSLWISEVFSSRSNRNGSWYM